MALLIENYTEHTVLSECMEQGSYSLGLYGYIKGYADDFAVTAVDGDLRINPGQLCINGKRILNSEAFTYEGVSPEPGGVEVLYDYYLIIKMIDGTIDQTHAVRGTLPDGYVQDDIFKNPLTGTHYVKLAEFTNTGGGINSANRVLKPANVALEQELANLKNLVNELESRVTNVYNSLQTSITNLTNKFKDYATVSALNTTNKNVTTNKNNISNLMSYKAGNNFTWQGASSNGGHARKMGRMVFMPRADIKLSGSISQNSERQVATISTNYRPMETVYVIGYVQGNSPTQDLEARALRLRIDTSGRCYVYNPTRGTLAAGTDIEFGSATWISANYNS